MPFARRHATTTHTPPTLPQVLGQLTRFIERDELLNYHIVTYSFGDMEAVYLRGQWTFHQNTPTVNGVWKGCKHLGAGLQYELFQKVAWARRMEALGKKSYHKRFLSAEGCYSHRAAHTPGLRIKVANKQFVGLAPTVRRAARLASPARPPAAPSRLSSPQNPPEHDVYVLSGALWVCKRGPWGAPDLKALLEASAPACDLDLSGVQHEMGDREGFDVTRDGCGNWMPQEFRMCAKPLAGAEKTQVVVVDGSFYSQGYDEEKVVLADRGRCRQGAFFHMQEWKKRWGDGNANVDARAAHDRFVLSQDGIHELRVAPAMLDAGWVGV